MRGRPLAYTPEQVERIRELAVDHFDPQIGALLGFPEWKIQHIRRRYGIPTFYRNRWAPEQLEAIRVTYVVEGLTAGDTGARFGITSQAVRALAVKHKWKRAKCLQYANAAIAVRARMPAKGPVRVREPRGRSQPPNAFHAAPTRFLTGSDADLVADFLSRKAVTALPAGTAAGLSAMEQMFFAARPALTGTKAQAEKKRLARTRGSIVKHNELRRTAAMGIAAE